MDDAELRRALAGLDAALGGVCAAVAKEFSPEQALSFQETLAKIAGMRALAGDKYGQEYLRKAASSVQAVRAARGDPGAD